MKVATIRERLIHRVAEVVQGGTLADAFIASDQLRVIAGALAHLPGDADVDLDTFTVDTAQAAQMLSYHAEHVRRLIRQGHLRSTKVGVDYRIPLSEVFTALVRRHHTGPPPELLPAAPPSRPLTAPADGDLELAIDVMVTRGPEHHSIRLQRFSVELGELLRDQLAQPGGEELQPPEELHDA